MATAVYGTDLALIDDAQAVGSYSATGGGASGLADETDYFINGSQCISKAGFTATQKGIIHDDVSAPTIAAGDAVFIWGRQANRNILDTIANSGGAVIMGTSNAVFQGFNVDGSNAPGSNLLSWVSYAVDPTQTPSYASGSPGAPSTWDHFGMEWKILGSGSLKGNPNAVGVSRHGRELQVTEGFTVAFGTFAGAASTDTTNRWGILIEVAGGYQFHGDFVMGTTATAVDFRDADRVISVLEDPFVPVGFNEFEIRNASSNVQWDNIQIQALGTTSPYTLTFDVGTFTGDSCFFTGAGTSIFNSSGSMTNSTFKLTDQITAAGADFTGSKVLGSVVVANDSALVWNVATDMSGLIDSMTFEMGAASSHAIEIGLTATPTASTTFTISDNIFTGYNTTTNNQNDSTFHILKTTGTVTINISGSGTTASNLTYRTEGATVVIQQNVTLTFDKMRDNSEVRVYSAGTKTELAGIEIATAGSTDNRSFGASLGAGVSVDYTIVCNGFEIIRVEGFTWPSANQTLNIAQRIDRNEI